MHVHVHVINGRRGTQTSPAMYFCRLKILSYTSSLRAKAAMWFSKASLSNGRPRYLLYKKEPQSSANPFLLLNIRCATQVLKEKKNSRF